MGFIKPQIIHMPILIKQKVRIKSIAVADYEIPPLGLLRTGYGDLYVCFLAIRGNKMIAHLVND